MLTFGRSDWLVRTVSLGFSKDVSIKSGVEAIFGMLVDGRYERELSFSHRTHLGFGTDFGMYTASSSIESLFICIMDMLTGLYSFWMRDMPLTRC